MRAVLQTLKFQIVVALGLLVSLFAGAILYTLVMLNHQRSDDLLIRLAGQLQLTHQHLSMQAMNYTENAPRDYPAYYRDVKLYYRDLTSNRAQLEAIIDAFASNRFSRDLTGAHMYATPQIDRATHQAAIELQTRWRTFSRTLDEKLGPDKQEPRLEWAAEWVLQQHADLELATSRLWQALQRAVDQRANEATLFGRLILVSGLGITVLILLWFYVRILRPLNVALQGFRTVATGNFAHRVPIPVDNEIGWMIGAFNQLSARLDAMRNLITRLQEARSLDETLAAVSDTLPGLVPLDWIGILIQGPDGRMHLQQAYSDGKPEPIVQQAFELSGTMLEECLHTGNPIHIESVRETALLDRHYRFLGFLASHQREEAVFVPIIGSKPVVGIAVFASRNPNTYRGEHLSLLYNLSHLFSVSFGRTVTLVESSRLATIGQFASGIVHEVRNPLATISLALEHFSGLPDIPVNSRKRAGIALQECSRLSHLMEDILLYAKPLQLKLENTGLLEVFDGFDAHSAVNDDRVLVDRDALQRLPSIALDKDRIRQVFVNLLDNAVEANGDDPKGVRVSAEANQSTETVDLIILNGGKAIPETQLARLFEPFYTTKPGGTGLGLPIVRRIIDAHGGEITIQSNERDGTRVTIRMPWETP